MRYSDATSSAPKAMEVAGLHGQRSWRWEAALAMQNPSSSAPCGLGCSFLCFLGKVLPSVEVKWRRDFDGKAVPSLEKLSALGWVPLKIGAAVCFGSVLRARRLCHQKP